MPPVPFQVHRETTFVAPLYMHHSISVPDT